MSFNLFLFSNNQNLFYFELSFQVVIYKLIYCFQIEWVDPPSPPHSIILLFLINYTAYNYHRSNQASGPPHHPITIQESMPSCKVFFPDNTIVDLRHLLGPYIHISQNNYLL